MASSKDQIDQQKYLHRFNGELYPKHISRRMFSTAFIFPLVVLQAYIYECYILSALGFLVFLASINYWRCPQYGLRRNMDVVNTVFVVAYHMMYALTNLDQETGTKYVFLASCGSIFFLISLKAREYGYLNVDSFFHCGMHTYGSLLNIWLYPQIYQHRISGKLY